MRGEELTPWLIWYGYRQGAFPMTMEDGEVEWFQPRWRCLFPIKGLRVSRSLAKTIRKGKFDIRFDGSFEEVIRGCFRPEDNWLSEHFVRAYLSVFEEGWGHCAECRLDGKLVGGVYGVAIGSCFCAESMFHRTDDASKVALWAMVEHCRDLGFTLFDAQILNPHLASLGAYEIPHWEYMEALQIAMAQETPWSRSPHAQLR